MKTITFDYSNPEHIRSGRFKEAWRTATDGEYPCIKVQGLEFDELKLVNISFDDLAFFYKQYREAQKLGDAFCYTPKGYAIRLTLVKTPPAQE